VQGAAPISFLLKRWVAQGASDWAYGPLVGGGLAGMLLRAIGK